MRKDIFFVWEKDEFECWPCVSLGLFLKVDFRDAILRLCPAEFPPFGSGTRSRLELVRWRSDLEVNGNNSFLGAMKIKEIKEICCQNCIYNPDLWDLSTFTCSRILSHQSYPVDWVFQQFTLPHWALHLITLNLPVRQPMGNMARCRGLCWSNKTAPLAASGRVCPG